MSNVIQKVTLTPEQSAAFSRGESILLAPTPPAPEPKPVKTYIVIGTAYGTVYEVQTSGEIKTVSDRYADSGFSTSIPHDAKVKCLRTGQSGIGSNVVRNVSGGVVTEVKS